MFENPLLSFLMTTVGMAPYGQDQLKHEDFFPAYQKAFEVTEQNLKKITERSLAEPATFENTILAYDRSSETLDRLLGHYQLFFNLVNDSVLDEGFKEINHQYAMLVARVLADEQLFYRVREVYENRHKFLESDQITEVDLKLIEDTYQFFVLEGALLSKEDQKRKFQINARLIELSKKYVDNLRKDMAQLGVWVDDPADLAGLPEGVISKARQVASGMSDAGGKWFFSVQTSVSNTVLSYAQNRSLRHAIFKESEKVGMGVYTNNLLIAKEMAQLRFQSAQLLGFKNHMDYRTVDSVVGGRDKVAALMAPYYERVRKGADAEVQELQAFARNSGELDGRLEIWDTQYFMTMLKKEKYGFDSEMLRDFFSFESVMRELFLVIEETFGVRIQEIPGAPVYHADVVAFSASDLDGKHYGDFYFDRFARKEKSSNAWHANLRKQGYFAGAGVMERGLSVVVSNFAKPAGKYEGLTPEEIRTVAHEFGHLLHAMLSEVPHKSLSGTSVPFDFVEFPSKFMERLVLTRDFYERVAKHRATGERLDSKLLDQIISSKNFMASTSLLSTMGYEALDMGWHGQDPSKVDDVARFEAEVHGPYRLLRDRPMRNTSISARFAHIFPNGYDGFYHSYSSGDLFAADAISLFENVDKSRKAELGSKMCRDLLSRGGSQNASQMYRNFRGRDATPDAWLREMGI